MALGHAVSGNLVESSKHLATLIDNHADEAAIQIASVFAMHGDNDSALEWLAIAREQRDTGLSVVRVRPWLSGLHDDPRWQPFLATLGKSDAQLADIDFDVAVPET